MNIKELESKLKIMKAGELLLKIGDIDSMYLSIEEKINLKLKIISQFKSEICKDQRENCANIFYKNGSLPYDIKIAVSNANEPQ